jgi:ABC-2 type transport system ATP-binding protein
MSGAKPPASPDTVAPDTVARADGLVKNFKGAEKPALNGVSLDVLTGRVTGLVGPDGAGKTTLIRILAGLMAADAGSVSVLGDAPGKDMEQIGYMPQRFGLYEDLTVQQNLDLYAEMRALPDEQRAETFDRLLAFTDLARFRDRLAGALSGGMKQKLGLACALVKTPRLLLLDEPGVGVDPISRRELWAMVQELISDGPDEQGLGVLWSTAYLDEAEKCDHVYLLSEGELLFSGDPAGLTRSVDGRVVRLTGFQGRRRHVLTQMLDRDGVLDGTIQGRSVRLLLKTPDELARETGFDLVPAQPRFEDGFIERLGGGPKGTSALAEAYRTIEGDEAPAIEAKGLTRRFGDFTAASDVSFTVPYGSIFGLLGPNGAGKSTTFKMLCGLLTPSEGSGAVAGHDLRTSGGKARSALGYMAQKFSLYGELSVAQNLNFFAGAYGLEGREARRAVERVTDIFELGDRMKATAGTLPLGFKQRLALAAAVLHEPPVLFLDEPTSGVDPVTRREFWMHINGLVEKGVAVLVTTHFMEEAEYCDAITLIYRSEQIASGTPDELKAQAADMATLDDPTMEDTFIAMIEASDARRERAESESV